MNAEYTVSGAINKRNGTSEYLAGSGLGRRGFGMTTYEIDFTSSDYAERIFTLSGTGNIEHVCYVNDGFLRVMTKERADLVGIDANVSTVELLADETNSFYELRFYNDEGTILYQSGNLKTKSGTTLNTELTTPGVAGTASGQICTSTSFVTNIAAGMYIPFKLTSVPTSGARDVHFNWIKDSKVVEGDTKFGALPNALFSQDIESHNHSFAKANNVLYIAHKDIDLMKFDGKYCYRAGLPAPSGITAAFDTGTVGGSGTEPDANLNYDYKFVYEYIDNQNNIITSDAQTLTLASATAPGNFHPINISVSNFPEENFEFRSGNIVLKIYRTEGYTSTSPGVYYLVNTSYQTGGNPDRVNFQKTSGSAACPPSAATYVDNKHDDELNKLLLFAEPIKKHSLPPKGLDFIRMFNNCLIGAGKEKVVNATTLHDGNEVSYSLAFNSFTGEIGTEYFPDDDNSFRLETDSSGAITGMAPLRDLLYIFHQDSIHVLSGDLSDTEGIPYVIDLLNNESSIGCLSHHSLLELKNSIVFLADKGIFAVNNTGELQELSSNLRPIFAANQFNHKLAVSTNLADKNLFIITIPKKENNEKEVLVLDYYRGAWLKWSGLDFSGGIASTSSDIFFATNRQNQAVSTGNSVRRFNDTGTQSDFHDNFVSVNMNYDTNWESLGEPTVPKKYLRLKVHAFDTEGTFESPGFFLDVAIQKDYLDADKGTITLDFGGTNTGWGSVWANDIYGDVVPDSRKSKLPTGKSKCMKLRFINNNIMENVLITSYELEIAAPYATEIKD